MHAQEIVLELQGSLRVDAWDGAVQLSSIYAFLHSEMVRANVSRDVNGYARLPGAGPAARGRVAPSGRVLSGRPRLRSSLTRRLTQPPDPAA